MSMDVILSINPGTTTTRCALVALQGEGLEVLVEETLDHEESVIAGFPTIAAQLDFRREHIEAFRGRHLGRNRLVACAGRGAKARWRRRA